MNPVEVVEVPAPAGFCRCGCGQHTSIAKKTHRGSGHVKGQPLRFLPSHNTRVRYGPWIKHYWSQVDKNGPTVRPELGPCWVWIGSRFKNGYGKIEVNGRTRLAHQVAPRA